MEIKNNRRSWSYRQGYKVGLQIVKDNNSKHGYFADEENKKAVCGFQRQIDNGGLSTNQVEWRKGVIDSIRSSYSKYGAHLTEREEGPFERQLRIHDYGEKKPYDGTNWRDD